jgi:hypothetical protein
MKTAEASVAFLSHVAFEDRRIGLAQIDNYQAIDDVGKFPVEVESDQSSANFSILFDQDRQAFAIFFHIGNRLAEFVKVAQDAAQGATIPAAQFVGSEGCAGLNEVGEFATILPLLKVTDNHLARKTAVFIADANGSE